MHLFHCLDASCGSTPMESSARYQLLELDINGTPSAAPINNGAPPCFLDELFVKTAHFTLF